MNLPRMPIRMLKAIALGIAVQLSILSFAYAESDKKVDDSNIIETARTITGKVTGEDGVPLEGATVLEKGTQNGALTDANGEFRLDVADGAVIVISYYGYTRQEIVISDQTRLEVNLEPDMTNMDEVVVIGYGERVMGEISGSVSTVGVEQISQNPTANLSNALAGQAAGIIATQPSGAPGADGSRILIRGVGTTGGTDPLYVIDGIVRSSSDFFQLNSSEIESVTILKDAASAAVFGMRAGNGVILVTTKRGREGRMQITFNSNFGIQERTREPEFLNSHEYATLRNLGLENSGMPPEYSDEDLQKYLDGSSPNTHPSTDWFDLLNETAPIQQHNLSANGGTDKVRYATSLSYLSQDGITPSDNFTRYNFRSNIDADVTNTTRFSFDISGRSQTTKSLGKSDELFRWLNTQPNKYPLEFTNGGVASGPAYIALPENGYRRNDQDAIRTRMEIKQEIPFVEGLAVKLIGSYDRTFTGYKNWYYPVVPFYVADGTGALTAQPLPANSLDIGEDDNKSITLQAHMNYDRTFGKLAVSGLVLYTQTETTWDFIGGHREGYTIGIDELNFGGVENRTNSGWSGSAGRQGVVGRLNLKYADKYIFETSVRVDGSEQFAPDQRWGVFPSVSAAYVISEEAFMKNVSFIEFLKLRASYGVLGNDQIGGARFLYLQSFNINAGRYPGAVFGDGVFYPTIQEGSLANPNVTWETIAKLDIGFDAFLMDGKFSLTFDYFYDKRSDILGSRNRTVPDFFGVSLPVENLNAVDNQGFETSLGYHQNISNDFRFSLNGNLTYAKNKVVFFDEPEDIDPNLSAIGHPLGMTFGYRALGIFQTEEEVANWAFQGRNTAPGDIKMEDVSGPEGVPDSVVDQYDRVPLGVSSGWTNVPNYIFGLSGQIHYKGLQLSFLLQGATGVNQYVANEGNWPFFGDASIFRSNLDYWTPDNTDAPNPRILVDNAGTLNREYSSFWLRDASYVRLKNVELSYNLPVNLLGIRFMQGCRVYVNANNVATWTKIKDWDPEYADDRSWTYPQLRVWNAGFQLTF